MHMKLQLSYLSLWVAIITIVVSATTSSLFRTPKFVVPPLCVCHLILTIDRISRDQYLNIPNKLTRARPVQFVVERQIAPQVTVWPAPDQVYYLIIDKLVRMDDAGSGVNTLQIPFRFYPCLAAGLAYYISLKKAPERAQMLKIVYDEEFERAAQEDRDRAPLQLTPVRDFYRVV